MINYLGPTTSSGALDLSFWFIFWTSVVLLAGVISAMVFFVFKYSRKRHPQPENIEGSVWLEITWTAIPTALVMVMFYFGWSGDEIIRHPPPDSMVIKVTAQMWSWQFGYENGKSDDELYVPVGRPVKLIIESRDVNHGFFIAAFGLKQDAIPGRQNSLWFQATVPETYDIQCSQYCGTRHSQMLTKLHVLPGEEFDKWYKTITPVEQITGSRLLRLKGCLSCHSTDGSRLIGPSLKGVFGSKVQVLMGNKEMALTADEDYLKESILDPDAKIVAGYPRGKMPSQRGVLKEGELEKLVLTLKDLN